AKTPSTCAIPATERAWSRPWSVGAPSNPACRRKSSSAPARASPSCNEADNTNGTRRMAGSDHAQHETSAPPQTKLAWRLRDAERSLQCRWLSRVANRRGLEGLADPSPDHPRLVEEAGVATRDHGRVEAQL